MYLLFTPWAMTSTSGRLFHAESKKSTRPLVFTRKNLTGKWIILLCLTEGRVQNGRWTSKNSEILWTLPWFNNIVISKQLNCFSTDDDTRSFYGQFRLRSYCTENAVRSLIYTVHIFHTRL